MLGEGYTGTLCYLYDFFVSLKLFQKKKDARYLNVQRYVHKDVNCSIACNSKKLKRTQISVNWILGKLCYIHIINIVIKKNHIAYYTDMYVIVKRKSGGCAFPFGLPHFLFCLQFLALILWPWANYSSSLCSSVSSSIHRNNNCIYLWTDYEY